MAQPFFPRSRNSGCHFYAPSIEQVLDWWSYSQLRLPTYRFKHNSRYHPYPRYTDCVTNDPFLETVDERDEFPASQPPAYPHHNELHGNVREGNDHPVDIVNGPEDEEKRRFIQITQNLAAAADRLIHGPPK